MCKTESIVSAAWCAVYDGLQNIVTVKREKLYDFYRVYSLGVTDYACRTARLTFLMFMSATRCNGTFTISVYSALRAAPLYTTRDTSIAAPLDQQTPSAEDAGEEYIVQAGDSLYKISGDFMKTPAPINALSTPPMLKPPLIHAAPLCRSYHSKWPTPMDPRSPGSAH
ncbi:MAG: hypothetical protein R2932_27600 [Caldilineaceae bacterium]